MRSRLRYSAERVKNVSGCVGLAGKGKFGRQRNWLIPLLYGLYGFLPPGMGETSIYGIPWSIFTRDNVDAAGNTRAKVSIT